MVRVEYKVPCQHAVRSKGEGLHGLLDELIHQDLNEGQDIISIWLCLVIQLRLYGASRSSAMIYLAKISLTEVKM